MCKITESPSSVSSPCEGLVLGDDFCPSSQHAQEKRDQPSDQTHQQQRRRVRFGNNIEHVFEKDFTDDDIPQIWYNCQEFVEMKAEIYAMIRFVQQQLMLSGVDGNVETWQLDREAAKKFYWRGFEHIRQRRPRKEIRRKHMDDFIHFHKILDVTDPDGLGLFAGSSSKSCSIRARQLAIQDEAEAFKIYNGTDDEYTNDDASNQMLAADCTPVLGSTICRGEVDSNEYCLLQEMQQMNPFEDSSVLSRLITPYQLMAVFFPCLVC